MKKVLKAFIKFFYSIPLGLNFTKRIILTEEESTFLAISKSGYFPESGWNKSRQSQMPVNPNGEARPWFSYSANRFLESRLNNEQIVFEYGSGNSTLFIGSKVRTLDSVEHDKAWFELSNSHPFPNTQIHYCSLDNGDSYQKFPLSLNKEFDIMIIDGRRRVESAKYCITCLSKKGIIIFDDTEREKYSEGIELIKSMGFKSLEFWGMGLGSKFLKCTTIFYRAENCIGI